MKLRKEIIKKVRFSQRKREKRLGCIRERRKEKKVRLEKVSFFLL